MSQSEQQTGPEQTGQVDSTGRAKRDSLFLLAEVIRETGEPMGNAKVRNLSASGLMADCTFGFLPGDRLVFDLRGIGPVAGEVAWAESLRIGFSFDRNIDPQAARKPVVAVNPVENKIPLYLRYLNHPATLKR